MVEAIKAIKAILVFIAIFLVILIFGSILGVKGIFQVLGYFLVICAITYAILAICYYAINYAIKFIMPLIRLACSGIKRRNLGDELMENAKSLSQLKLEDKNSIFSKSYNVAKNLFNYNDRMCIAFAFKAESGYDKAINELNYNHKEATEFAITYATASMQLGLDYKEAIEFAKEQIRMYYR